MKKKQLRFPQAEGGYEGVSKRVILLMVQKSGKPPMYKTQSIMG